MSIALPGLLMTAPIPDADRPESEPPDRNGRSLLSGHRPCHGVVDRAVDGAVVTAAGDVDLATADRLRDRLLTALQAHRHVTVDLSAVAFMDCSGLRALIAARTHADRTGRRLTLGNPSRPVRRLLTAARLDHTTLRTRAQPRTPR